MALPSHWLPGAAVQTRLRGTTKTSSSAAGVSLGLWPRANRHTPQQEQARGGRGHLREGIKKKRAKRGRRRRRWKKKKKKERVCRGERRKIKAPHARKRGARSAAVLFMLLLSQVLIVPAVHHFQLPAPGPERWDAPPPSTPASPPSSPPNKQPGSSVGVPLSERSVNKAWLVLKG